MKNSIDAHIEFSFKRELKIDHLTRQTDIRNALVQAYKLGGRS